MKIRLQLAIDGATELVGDTDLRGKLQALIDKFPDLSGDDLAVVAPEIRFVFETALRAAGK